MRDARNTKDGASVAILMCTYNGAQYLTEQIESLANQTHTNWTLYVSDDGSTDGTLEMLDGYRERLGHDRIVLLQGPQQGFSKNFMSLIRNPSIAADFYSFCDQDDVWYADKLERGVGRIRGIANKPALYCSRTHLVDAQGVSIGYSPLFSKPPSFANALVQSLAGANTMLMNEQARQLLALTPADAHVVSHDWLSYLLVSGCDGFIFYDPQATLDYRQHGANLIGSNVGLRDRVRRIRKMFGGTFRTWNHHNLYALSGARGQLASRNRLRLEQFERARESGLFQRFELINQANLYRQTLLGNIGLAVAVGLRKF